MHILSPADGITIFIFSLNTDDILLPPGEFVSRVFFFMVASMTSYFFPICNARGNGFHLAFTLKANRSGSSRIISRIVFDSVDIPRDISHRFMMSVIFSGEVIVTSSFSFLPPRSLIKTFILCSR